MSKFPDLTEYDKIIMEIIWQSGSISSAEILKEAADKLGWSRQTTRTYLVRLADKGLVAAKALSARNFVYYPLVSKEEYAADKAKSVIKSYYGSLSHMLAGLIKEESLSETDINELEEFLKQFKDKDQGK